MPLLCWVSKSLIPIADEFVFRVKILLNLQFIQLNFNPEFNISKKIAPPLLSAYPSSNIESTTFIITFDSKAPRYICAPYDANDFVNVEFFISN